MVMKHALTKDTLREIKRSFGRFLSIFAIIAIGVAFFAGVKVSAPVMEHTADHYYDDFNLMDMRVVSTLGLTDDDIAEMEKISGVRSVYPTHSMDVMTKAGSSEVVLKVFGIPTDLNGEDDPQFINRPRLIEGRYPENSGECLIEQSELNKLGLTIGSKITLTTGTDQELTDSLKTTEYTVVGTAVSPRYISYEKGETTKLGNGTINQFMMVPEDDFKLDAYTEAVLTVENAMQEETYSDRYDETINGVKSELEKLGIARSAVRYDEVKHDAEQQIDMFRRQLPPGAEDTPEVQAQLTAMQQQVDAIQEPEWYVLDRNTLYGYADYKQSAATMDAIAKVFPVFFFLVAALVCLTTMTRMVDEQRQMIGTLKALGYSKFSIASKYIAYAAAASIAGSVVGLIIGLTVFPTVIFNAWNTMYSLPDVQLIFDIPLVLVTTLAAVIITTLAAFLACYNELMETPALLMRPKAPKQGKKILLERVRFLWKRMSFTQKVTARNLFRYKKRFYMTVIGISGCTALLLTGYGIKDSMGDVVKTQFGEIIKYDVSGRYEAGLSADQKDQTLAKLQADNRFSSMMNVSQSNAKLVTADGEEKKAALVVPTDVEQFKTYITLRDGSSKKELALSDDGVIISDQLALDLGLKEGDTLQLDNGDGKRSSVVVSGITENYLSHYVYMSPSYYKQVFDKEAVSSNWIAKLKEPSAQVEEQLTQEMVEDPNIASVAFNSTTVDLFEKSFGSIDYVLVLIILSAGALAFVVLYNLTNVNISERIREIATIKVLGFYDNEVSKYVYRENILLTIIGAGVGLVLGVTLHHFILSTLALDGVLPSKEIHWISYLLSVVITILFALFVNLVMSRKLKKIHMIESLKSVE
ncbi:ABC transporter permease [Paenibacillus marinisediminis]